MMGEMMHQQEIRGSSVELTILMPCLNEAETIVRCVEKAMGFLRKASVNGEVLIADNGSTDDSRQMACKAGARVVNVEVRGYGAALQGGIRAAKGRFVIMGDADDSYDFSALDSMLNELRNGNELVMGNRFSGGIAPGAMPFLHRYLGNPVLSMLGRLFYRVPIKDFHCGLRGFNRDSMMGLGLETSGMEFASEMIVKSALNRLKIAEVPVTLSKDGRSRPPHLRTWRDGWRHLRFLLLFSPRWLFLLPGLALLVFGTAGMAAIGIRPLVLGPVSLDIHTMAYAGAAVIIGFQMMLFAVFTKMIGVYGGWFPKDDRINHLSEVTLEYYILGSIFLFLVSVGISLHALMLWKSADYGGLDPRVTMRWVVPAVTIMTVAGELFLTGFFMESLRLLSRRRGAKDEYI